MQPMKRTSDALVSSIITQTKGIIKESQIFAFAMVICLRYGEKIKAKAAAALKSAFNYTLAHPVTVGTLVAGIGAVVAPSLVAAPILGAFGFTANGVAAGSAAAAVQSGIGNVVAGGVFATLQSAAAGGYGVMAVNMAVQLAGAAVASIGGATLGRF